MKKWPKKVKHRNKVLAKIYARCRGRDSYRVAWTVGGRRLMKSFRTYGGEDGAKHFAENLVKDLAKNSPATALSQAQAADALIALEKLKGFRQQSGRGFSLAAAVSEFCEASAQLHGHTLSEAVQGYLRTVATVRRVDLAEAVTEFIERRRHLGESKNGERSKRSPVYLYNTAMWLNEFAGAFPGHAVSDLSKDHLCAYMQKFGHLSAKSRNDRRAIVKMFLCWCVAKDFLSTSHRLFDAVDFKTEEADQREIDFYRPKELRDMLTTADPELVPVLTLGALGGLRREEILRLTWPDVWHVKGKIEISARIAKGRKRRLVDICPALAAWLKPWRAATGPVWAKSPDALEEALAALRGTLKIPARRNGLRHAFITFHMAMHANENLTAAEAGSSPQMLHDHYRALATAAEAKKWFGVKPPKNPNVIPLIACAASAAD